ncbi:MAG TPA: hypothetical protein ENK58_04600 [Desulfobacterales bacterium]|nr:MAG: hypothetical protein DRI57_08025 [Deltaproteobacteria bacterium]HHC24682.1 hypothetical protein [Desulfobacterales bacterium]
MSPEVPISDWLRKTLAITSKIPLKSEKARSEGMIAPILFELKERNEDKITLLSGEYLDIDPQQGLNGECDFILTKTPYSTTLESPVFCVVEAKQHILENSLGQGVAQMVGAREFNRVEGTAVETIFGAVTSGEVWQFLKLSDSTIYTDRQRYFIENPARLSGILQSIVDFY